jgi:hypothetical protein
MNYKFILATLLAASSSIFAQSDIKTMVDKVMIDSSMVDSSDYKVFHHTRITNSHSVEVLKAKEVDVRLAQRFGNVAIDGFDYNNFFGLNELSDLFIGLDYGISNRLMIGINHTFGVGPLRNNVNGHAKAKIMSQNVSTPISIALVFIGSLSTMDKIAASGSLANFSKFFHRLSYHNELIVGRSFGKKISIQALGGATFRNLVPRNDENIIISAGLGAAIKVNDNFSINLDARKPFNDLRTSLDNMPLGLGLQFTGKGGTMFQINVASNASLVETDMIPYTNANLQDGNFRLGFSVSKVLNQSMKK